VGGGGQRSPAGPYQIREVVVLRVGLEGDDVAVASRRIGASQAAQPLDACGVVRWRWRACGTPVVFAAIRYAGLLPTG